MSGEMWVALIVGTIIPSIMILVKYFIDAKYHREATEKIAEIGQVSKMATEKIAKVEKGTLHVIEQNQAQEKKIDDATKVVTKTAQEIDGRLTEYRRLVEAKAIVDVAAALVEGEKRGAARERGIAEEKAKGVLVIQAEKEANGEKEKKP